MTLTLSTPAELLDHIGADLGTTDWMEIDQARIDRFADATGDHQWIHVDPERAADGPFGATIAHGYLTLSLANLFLPELLVVEQISMGLNIGVEKVRFPYPVRVGSRLRGRGELVDAKEAGGGVQVVVRISVEVDGAERPGCVVDAVARYLP